MALARKDYGTTGAKREREYDKWAIDNPVIPTMQGDPDFGIKQWEKMIAGNFDVSVDFSRLDFPTREPESVTLQSLAESTIAIMSGEDEEWNKALNILYPKEEEGRLQD